MLRGDGHKHLPMYAYSSSTAPRQRFAAPLSSHSFPTELIDNDSEKHKLSYLRPPWIRNTFRFRSNSSPPYVKSRTCLMFLVFALLATIFILLVGWYIYEPHIELAFYNRSWVHREIEPVYPLAGCFEEERVSPRYNVSQYVHGRKRTEVQAGMALRLGLDCYDFAGTIQKSDWEDSQWDGEESRGGYDDSQRTLYHTYWRTDLTPFGPRQEWMLKSFFATQDLENSRLILWSNGDFGSNEILKKYTRLYPDAFSLRIIDVHALARGTELEEMELLDRKDTKAWVDGDLIRLLLLWNFGGVWVDMDSLLTRDLHPLLEHEFVTQWDCYDKVYAPLNGALMRFRQHSPYLCEAFRIIATSPPPREGSTDWGMLLYFKLWRRLVAGSIPPFKILPFCFSDGRSCRLDNRLPDPFAPDNEAGKWTMGLGLEEGGGLDRVLGKVFGVHLHNQWEKSYPVGGWVDRLLLRRYDAKLGSIGSVEGVEGSA